MYGNTLEAFSMVQTLLAVGVPGSRVVLVQPPVSIPTCFNNPFIEDAVTAALKECGRCRLISLKHGAILYNEAEVLSRQRMTNAPI